ncbi:MAG: hypothetical protein MZV70_33255 [Desulfobacterales bacterium]|nr:hypothetical protein [Desulfobacterales bacterium]
MLARLRDYTGRLEASNRELEKKNQELDRAHRRLRTSLSITQELAALAEPQGCERLPDPRLQSHHRVPQHGAGRVQQPRGRGLRHLRPGNLSAWRPKPPAPLTPRWPACTGISFIEKDEPGGGAPAARDASRPAAGGAAVSSPAGVSGGDGHRLPGGVHLRDERARGDRADPEADLRRVAPGGAARGGNPGPAGAHRADGRVQRDGRQGPQDAGHLQADRGRGA